MFFGGFLRRSNYNWKKRYSCLAVGWNKSQITVCRVKIRTPPITLSFKKILIGFLYFTETMRSKLSDTVYLFLALYGSTTIQSRLFLKNIENFVWFPKQYLLGFFILENQLANIPDWGFLFLRNTLLLYSLSPYSQTERQTESQIHLLCVGWRNLFSSCAVVSCQFLVLAGNRQFFCCSGKVLLRPEKKDTVVCLAGCAVVSVFGSGGK